MHEALRSAIASGTGVAVPQIAAALGTSRNVIYRAIERGEIESIRIGRRVVVPAPAAALLLGIKSEPETIAA